MPMTNAAEGSHAHPLLGARRCEDHDMSDPFINVIQPPEGGPYACPCCGLSP